MGSPYEFDEYPYDGYADEEDTQLRGAIVSPRKGKVCDKEMGWLGGTMASGND
ncbi:MAG: hypothetical protein ROO76_07490 [Terriglobia bacterium]|nr:hypothetical protein [Terriglobia bacterium]